MECHKNRQRSEDGGRRMKIKEKCKDCIHTEYCGGNATIETDKCFFKITTQEVVWKNPNKSEIPTGQIVANGELYPGEFDDPLAAEGSEE